jgi:hypothetical protein
MTNDAVIQVRMAIGRNRGHNEKRESFTASPSRPHTSTAMPYFHESQILLARKQGLRTLSA